ncbi:hypothetical protein [Thermasporomyces composti]|uniref:Uncharacterized protein n=1 Tax=Thermasporomyces composti TaxID=696763 RepID=A0A3D9VG76_THECX|nr:hypothetical protein [Thermasporomyces composti]REF37154.1 hypothetical protein DFJ64_2591 [Thermasporomyces composti]
MREFVEMLAPAVLVFGEPIALSYAEADGDPDTPAGCYLVLTINDLFLILSDDIWRIPIDELICIGSRTILSTQPLNLEIWWRPRGEPFRGLSFTLPRDQRARDLEEKLYDLVEKKRPDLKPTSEPPPYTFTGLGSHPVLRKEESNRRRPAPARDAHSETVNASNDMPEAPSRDADEALATAPELRDSGTTASTTRIDSPVRPERAGPGEPERPASSRKTVIDEVIADAPALKGPPSELRLADKKRLIVSWNFALTAGDAGLCDDGLRLALTRLTHTHTSAQWWNDSFREGTGKSFRDLVDALEPALTFHLRRMTEVDLSKHLANWQPKTRKEREVIAHDATERFRQAIVAASYAGVDRARIVWLATQPVTPLGTTNPYIFDRAEWVERVLDENAAHAEQWWRKLGEPDEYDAQTWVVDTHRMAVQAKFDVLWPHSVYERKEDEQKEEVRDANSETGNDDSALTLW